ncbi:hypothetical protein D9M68_962750 [compost metagenome]
MQEHLAAGLGAPGFDEAQVARGDIGLAGEVELTEAATLAPLAQQGADGVGMCSHGNER